MTVAAVPHRPRSSEQKRDLLQRLTAAVAETCQASVAQAKAAA